MVAVVEADQIMLEVLEKQVVQEEHMEVLEEKPVLQEVLEQALVFLYIMSRIMPQLPRQHLVEEVLLPVAVAAEDILLMEELEQVVAVVEAEDMVVMAALVQAMVVVEAEDILQMVEKAELVVVVEAEDMDLLGMAVLLLQTVAEVEEAMDMEALEAEVMDCMVAADLELLMEALLVGEDPEFV